MSPYFQTLAVADSQRPEPASLSSREDLDLITVGQLGIGAGANVSKSAASHHRFLFTYRFVDQDPASRG
ncbi:unnamed protein product [Lampetra fluviatilis]